MKSSTRMTRIALLTVLTGVMICPAPAQDKPTPVRKYAGGLKFNRTRSLTVMNKAPLATRSFANLPAEVSYEKYCPSVGDQGQQETSVAFATAYYLRTIMEGKEQNITKKPLLDQARFSPTFVYDKIRDPKDVNCQGGGTIEEALEVLKTDGAPHLQTLGYPLCNQAIPPAVAKEAEQFRIGDYQQLFTDQTPADQKILAVKKALAEGNPVVAGIGAPLSFEEVRAVWEPAPNEKAADILYNQALCVVGYSDKQYGGAFRIVNSWNTGWGEKGFCWIPYTHFGKFTLNAFQVYGAQPGPGTASGVVVLTSTGGGKSVGNAPRPAADDSRRGSAELKLSDGSPMEVTRLAARGLKVEADQAAPTDIKPYRTLKPYTSGTRFKFYLNNSENAYVYALTTNKHGDFEKIFPHDELTSPLLGPNTTIAYPDETHNIVMDDHKGNDYLLILFSKRPLNMDGLIKTLDRKKGTLDKRVAEVLGDQLVRQDQIRYHDDQVAFNVKPDATGNVVPVLIEIEHK